MTLRAIAGSKNGRSFHSDPGAATLPTNAHALIVFDDTLVLTYADWKKILNDLEVLGRSMGLK